LLPPPPLGVVVFDDLPEQDHVKTSAAASSPVLIARNVSPHALAFIPG